jgi:hypothetical protein
VIFSRPLIALPGVTEFTVAAEEDEETADELLRQVWEALGHPSKRCQVAIERDPGVGWRITVKRTFHNVLPVDPHGPELEARLAQLDRRGRRPKGPP